MAGTFGNVSGTDYAIGNLSSILPVGLTKPTADVTGTVLDFSQTISSQSAGAFIADISGTPLSLNVITGPTNAPTIFQAGSQWLLGNSSHGATINCDNANDANAQKTACICVLGGIDTTSPIRASAVSTGTSSSPTCPTTASASVGDVVLRKVYYHDDGDELSVTRPGSHTAGPILRPPATDSKAIVIDFYVVSVAGAPGTATYGLNVSGTPISRAWVAETIVYRATATAGMLTRPGAVMSGGMQTMGGGMQGHSFNRSRIVVPANFHAFRNRGSRPLLRV